jgi:hypothetical protein
MIRNKKGKILMRGIIKDVFGFEKSLSLHAGLPIHALLQSHLNPAP